MTDHDKAATPITDRYVFWHHYEGQNDGPVEVVHADHCRQFELQVKSLQAKLEAERKANERWDETYQRLADLNECNVQRTTAAESALARCFEETRERCARMAEGWDYNYLAADMRALTQEPAETSAQTQNKDHG